MDGKLNKWNFDHTHFHPPLLKKKERQISWKCILFWHSFFLVFFTSAWARMSAANGLRVQTRIRSPFALALDFFYNHTFLFGTTPEASLHGVKCPALCVCVGVQHYKYGGWRENDHVKRMHCRSLSFPFLFSICLFFSSPGQSVCLSQFVCPHLHLHFCSVSCRPPRVSVHSPLLS